MRITSVTIVALALTASAAQAKPEGPRAFCAEYPESPTCFGKFASCSQCHAGPPNLNYYGEEVLTALYTETAYDGSNYEQMLPEALRAIEGQDADGDGVTTLEEIMLATDPGDAGSVFTGYPAPEGTIANLDFELGSWDAKFAYKRMMITYCGHSPTYEDMQSLSDAGDSRAFVHEQLNTCLQSDYWQDEALHRMADKRVRPLKAIGRDGDIILADYEWDYRLFAYVLTEDRDARDLLLADYHVNAEGEVETGRIGRDAEGAFPADGEPILIGSGQPLNADRRAGMITTQWYMVVNTMFSEMPRTTAAQAYRSYLGLDIARGEGIMPVEGEPRDVDNKGVQNPTCAACHSTLDPLAYAFSAYEGIRIDPVAQVLFGSNNTGTFDNGRTDYTEDGSLFNNPVPDLLSWADQAANSDQFKRNLADMFFEQALGTKAGPADHEELKALWQALPEDGYSANRLIHRLIDTDAFGCPVIGDIVNRVLTFTVLVALVGTLGCEQELLLNLPTDDTIEPVDNPTNDDDDPTKLPGEGEGEGEVEIDEPPPPPPPPQLAESTKGLLVWKRYRALEQDLMRGLALDKGQICQELGQYSCIDNVHLAALGGNEPFEKSQYEPSREPTATSSIAIDRVVLSACFYYERVRADRAGTATVFTGIDLAGTSVSDNESDEVTTTLFRKLLARDPLQGELEAMRGLTEDADGLPVGSADFATLACFAVGTHIEFLFF